MRNSRIVNHDKAEIPETTYIADVFRRYKRAYTISSDEIAQKMGISASSVRRFLRRSDMEWNLRDIVAFCEITGCPIDMVIDEQSRAFERKVRT